LLTEGGRSKEQRLDDLGSKPSKTSIRVHKRNKRSLSLRRENKKEEEKRIKKNDPDCQRAWAAPCLSKGKGIVAHRQDELLCKERKDAFESLRQTVR